MVLWYITDSHKNAIADILVLDEIELPDTELKSLLQKVAFVESNPNNSYLYYPPFAHVFHLDKKEKVAYIFSIFQLFKENVDSRNVSFLNKISHDFTRLTPELYNIALQIFFNNQDSVILIKNIKDERKAYSKEINDIITRETFAKPPMKSDSWSKSPVQHPKLSPTSTESSGSLMSYRLMPSPTDEVVVPELTHGFDINIRSYLLQLSLPTENDIDLRKVFESYKEILNENIISLGYDIEGKAHFKNTFINNDREGGKLINEFTKSEHTGTYKTLKVNTLYFLYHDLHGNVNGEIRSKGNIILKVFPKDLDFNNLEDSINNFKLIGEKIIERFKKYINFIISDKVSAYDISIKIIYKKGSLSLDDIARVFKGKKSKSTVMFDLEVNGAFISVLYSTKDKVSNFSVQRVSKQNIQKIVNNLYYPFKYPDDYILIEKEIIEKSQIKGFKKFNIKVFATECQKTDGLVRLPRIIGKTDDPHETLPENQTIFLNTKNEYIKLACDNNDTFKFPGLTKNSKQPCCFKNKKVITTSVVSTSSTGFIIDSVIMSKQIYKTDKTTMPVYTRAKLSNIVVSKIFDGKDYYALSFGDSTSIELESCLKYIYGDNIISLIITNTTKEIYEKYYIDSLDYSVWLDGPKSIESIFKAFSVYKKINPVIITEETNGTKFECNITHLFSNSKYIVIMNTRNTYRLIINTSNNKVKFEFSDKLQEIQELLKLYNTYCNVLTDCEFYIPYIADISELEINLQVVDKNSEVIYVRTKDYGYIIINKSKLLPELNKESVVKVEYLDYEEQYSKLVEISKKDRYGYLKPKAVTLNKDSLINGIEVQCNLIVPVKNSAKITKLPVSEQNFYLEFEDIKDSSDVTDAELQLYLYNLEEKYNKEALEIVIKYFNDDQEKKNDINNLIRTEDFDGIIKLITSLFIPKENHDAITDIPIQINTKIYLNVVTNITWFIITNPNIFL